jgi:predicted TIM-barrel fold metal-dependent hydrolase
MQNLYQNLPIPITPEVFDDWLRGRSVRPEDARAIEDAVIDHGLSRAADLHLPLKIHTGHHVGNDRMKLHDVRANVADVCDLARRYDTTFVLMHMGYPYEHEVLSATKHYTNVVADLSWAWIIDPLATITFVKRFLLTAPATKLLCFGGDYIPVENVVGHAQLARDGLARALEELRDAGYITDREIMELVPDLMHGNADRLFGLEDRSRA